MKGEKGYSRRNEKAMPNAVGVACMYLAMLLEGVFCTPRVQQWRTTSLVPLGIQKTPTKPVASWSWAKSNGQAAIIGECFTQFLEKVKFVFLFFQAFRVNYVS